MSSADTKPRELRAATPLNGEDIVAPERLAPWHPESIIVEITSAARYLMKRDAWHDLARRACEPNPYMDPAIVAAAAGPDGGADEIPVLLAWRGKQLVGAWAFSRSVPRSRFPLSVLTTPLREMLPNSTPVLDAGQIEAVLSAMMDAIVRARPLPKLLSIDMINDGGPVMHALQHVLAGRKCPMVILRRNQRPMLIGSAKPADHFGKMMSGNTRRSFNTKRRRLGKRGNLTLTLHRDREAIIAATDRFITLEASGWKKNSGASELARVRYREFLRDAVRTLAAHREIEIWETSLDNVPVSMALFLRHLSGAYCWKIAYDERQGDCSPGALLMQDYSAAYLTDPEVTIVDSSSADDTGVFVRFFDRRQPMVRLVADVRSGGSLAFTLWATFESAARKFKDAARTAMQDIRTG